MLLNQKIFVRFVTPKQKLESKNTGKPFTENFDPTFSLNDMVKIKKSILDEYIFEITE